MANEIWVRLKPLNERKGIRLQRYGIYGMRFEEKRGWYIVPAVLEMADGSTIDIAAKLRTIRNDNDDRDSPLAFDVMTAEEAKRLDADERKAAIERVAAVDARPLKAVDVTPTDTHGDLPVTEERGQAKRGRPRKSPPAGV
jgi:hypothetical protein